MASSEYTETASERGAAAPAVAAEGTAPAAARPAEARAENQRGLPGPVAAWLTPEAISVTCLTNAHYHSAREAFLDTVHRWFMFGVIVLGGAALVDIFPEDQKDWFKAACAAGAALLGALDLTFDLSNRARNHSMMKRRYFDVLANVRDEKMTPMEARVCLERFNGDEEPQYRILYLACWNLGKR